MSKTEKLWPSVSPLGNALRELAENAQKIAREQKGCLDIDANVLNYAAEALDDYNMWWVYSLEFMRFMEHAYVDLPPDLQETARHHLSWCKTLSEKMKKGPTPKMNEVLERYRKALQAIAEDDGSYLDGQGFPDESKAFTRVQSIAQKALEE